MARIFKNVYQQKVKSRKHAPNKLFGLQLMAGTVPKKKNA